MPNVAVMNEESIHAGNGPLTVNATPSDSNPSPNFLRAWYHAWILARNITVEQPIGNPPRFTEVALQFIQDASGSRTVAFASCWRDVPAGIAAGGAAGTVATLVFMYDGQSYQFIGGSSAFSVAGSVLVPQTGLLIALADPPVIPMAPPRPTIGAVTITGNSVTLIRSTATVITPGAGAATLAGVAGTQGLNIAPGNQGSFSLALLGQPPTLSHL